MKLFNNQKKPKRNLFWSNTDDSMSNMALRVYFGTRSQISKSFSLDCDNDTSCKFQSVKTYNIREKELLHLKNYHNMVIMELRKINENFSNTSKIKKKTMKLRLNFFLKT